MNSTLILVPQLRVYLTEVFSQLYKFVKTRIAAPNKLKILCPPLWSAGVLAHCIYCDLIVPALAVVGE